VYATSLKLPDDLKRRIAKLTACSGQTTHAFMVDALAREAERSELRQRFAAEAADSECEALGSGMAHSLNAALDYLAGRIAGKNPRRPRARPWRASEVRGDFAA
jgi:predicted transcriptional regulator